VDSNNKLLIRSMIIGGREEMNFCQESYRLIVARVFWIIKVKVFMTNIELFINL
jgi:hypothetical protein